MNWPLSALHKPIYVRDHWRCRKGEGIRTVRKLLDRKRMSEKRYGQELLQLEDKFNSLKRKLLEEPEQEECKNCKKLKEDVDLWKSRALFGKICLESLIEECKQHTELVVENLRELKEDDFVKEDILKNHGNSVKSPVEGSKLSKYFNVKATGTGSTVSPIPATVAAERTGSPNKP